MNRLGILLAAAMLENADKTRHWFIDYSGHVNRLKLKFYPNGWAAQSKTFAELDLWLTSEKNITAAILFLEQNLKKVPK